MYSGRAKMLHQLLGVPLVSYPVERALELHASPIVAVLGFQHAEVEKVLIARHGQGTVTVVEQTEQKGTGMPSVWAGCPARMGGNRSDSVRRRASVEPRDPDGAGEEVAPRGHAGHFDRRAGSAARLRPGDPRQPRPRRWVVEDKDASEDQRRITEVNAGIYAAPAAFLRQATARLSPRNAQGELYLTDIIAKAASSIGVVSVKVSTEEMAGVNDRQQLVSVEKILCRRIVEQFGKHATFRDPRRHWSKPVSPSTRMWRSPQRSAARPHPDWRWRSHRRWLHPHRH